MIVVLNIEYPTVSLTKTKAQGRPRKTKLVEDLRGAADEYKHIYVFKFENMRATIFKDIRMHFKESKIFMGKNKLAQVALGRSTEDEFKDNLMNLSQVSLEKMTLLININ